MKRFSPIFFVLILAAFLAACSPSTPAQTEAPADNNSGTTDDAGPAAAAQALMQAVYTGDAEAFAKVACTGATMDAIGAMPATPGATIDISGFQYSVVSQTDTDAEVQISGKLKVTVTVAGQSNSTETDIPAFSINLKNDNGWKFCLP